MEYIFDTHAHYDDEAFDEDRESLIGSLRENGIGNVCNIGASMESCRTTLAMAEKYPFFYGALGVHPITGMSRTGRSRKNGLSASSPSQRKRGFLW